MAATAEAAVAMGAAVEVTAAAEALVDRSVYAEPAADLQDRAVPADQVATILQVLTVQAVLQGLTDTPVITVVPAPVAQADLTGQAAAT
ncbi:MAG TPA: hypothetical protein DIW81_09830 [Planctomycetaceae bacterium]|nr:hypothetical protein [Planctomycetaceae bacterium]